MPIRPLEKAGNPISENRAHVNPGQSHKTTKIRRLTESANPHLPARNQPNLLNNRTRPLHHSKNRRSAAKTLKTRRSKSRQRSSRMHLQTLNQPKLPKCAVFLERPESILRTTESPTQIKVATHRRRTPSRRIRTSQRVHIRTPNQYSRALAWPKRRNQRS